MRAVVLCLLLSVSGCGGSATVRTTTVDNTHGIKPIECIIAGESYTLPVGAKLSTATATGKQPYAAAGAATAKITLPDGSAEANSGDAAELLQSLSGSFWYMLIGGIIALAGGVILVGRRSGQPWTVAIPKGTGRVMIIGGAIMAILPYFLEQYGWMIAVGVAVVAIPWLIKYIYNVFNKGKDNG